MAVCTKCRNMPVGGIKLLAWTNAVARRRPMTVGHRTNIDESRPCRGPVMLPSHPLSGRGHRPSQTPAPLANRSSTDPQPMSSAWGSSRRCARSCIQMYRERELDRPSGCQIVAFAASPTTGCGCCCIAASGGRLTRPQDCEDVPPRFMTKSLLSLLTVDDPRPRPQSGPVPDALWWAIHPLPTARRGGRPLVAVGLVVPVGFVGGAVDAAQSLG